MNAEGKASAAILFARGPVEGRIDIRHARMAECTIAAGDGWTREGKFRIDSAAGGRLHLSAADARTGPGPGATIVTVTANGRGTSFFLRDVNAETPMWVPERGLAVTTTADARDYGEIREGIAAAGRQSVLQRIESEPEETYERAAARTRDQISPTWLGLSRDMRIFQVDYNHAQGYLGTVTPLDHGSPVRVCESEESPLSFGFVLGRGAGCVREVSRRLEEGCLPILNARQRDGDIEYDLTAFVALERSPLTRATLRGTHFLVADAHAGGHMFTEGQQARAEALCEEERNREEETVLFGRVVVTNTADVPRYAWFRAALPNLGAEMQEGRVRLAGSGRVCALNTLDGAPLPQEELAILLQPGGAARFEFRLPHRPINDKRAAALMGCEFEEKLNQCRRFWQEKLHSAGRLSLPERTIDEMARAGLLHLDLVAYGHEPDGTLAPTIGRYAPIGSESAPIIQFFDSMGWHDVARRSIQYFLDKQHDDGFIQNFGGYMLETGPALWTIGEHYRYTRDDEWAAKVRDQVVLSCEFMKAWRQEHEREDLRSRGYGMQAGKVADPQDPYHYFMLNGYAALGMARTAEMLQHVDPVESERWAAEAREFRVDVRESFQAAVDRSPVVPLGDGSWVPTCPPWAEATGPLSLFAEPGRWWTHGTCTARDSLVGPLYLVFQEMVEAHEAEAGFMERWHSALFTARNVAFSQPYYSRHPWLHLRRGHVRAFLKAYYNGLTSLADRGTYSWWEHFFGASPHKTHEEGWFLMQTRWMLWLESGDEIHVFPGVPRRWLEDGREIRLDRVATYFGPMSVRLLSGANARCIEAEVEFHNAERAPQTVHLRLPQPQHARASSVQGGVYDPKTETVTVREAPGAISVTALF